MIDPPQCEDPVLALLLDEQEALAEEWVREDRAREMTGRQIELQEFASRRQREAA